MSENLIGFPNMIHNQFVRPLENSKKFKEQYKDADVSIFFNITDSPYLAVLTVKSGTISVKSIAQEDTEKVEDAEKNCKVQIKTPMQLFVAMDDMSTFKVMGKMISGKLKIKGAAKLKILQKLRALANEEDEAAVY